jgi:hypothetical protein
LSNDIQASLADFDKYDAIKNKAKMIFDKTLIRERIKEVAIRENDLPEGVADDIAFHMTDWIEDLEQYVGFCTNPSKITNQELDHLLMAFLIHVPNHIAAASKLFTELPVRDIFGVGATSEDKES